MPGDRAGHRLLVGGIRCVAERGKRGVRLRNGNRVAVQERDIRPGNFSGGAMLCHGPATGHPGNSSCHEATFRNRTSASPKPAVLAERKERGQGCVPWRALAHRIGNPGAVCRFAGCQSSGARCGGAAGWWRFCAVHGAAAISVVAVCIVYCRRRGRGPAIQLTTALRRFGRLSNLTIRSKPQTSSETLRIEYLPPMLGEAGIGRPQTCLPRGITQP